MNWRNDSLAGLSRSSKIGVDVERLNGEQQGCLITASAGPGISPWAGTVP